MTAAEVVQLRPTLADGEQALAAFIAHVERCSLSLHSKRAYKRWGRTYVAWCTAHVGLHPDAFLDVVGAESAMSTWRRELLDAGQSASSVGQALAAVTMLYQVGLHMTTKVKRPKVPKPGAPQALTRNQEAALRRAADRRGPRDSAIIHLFLETGARVEEMAGLKLPDIPVTARTGKVRLVGKGDEVRHNPVPAGSRERVTAWLAERDRTVAGKAGNELLVKAFGQWLWIGQRGRLTQSGLTKLVAAIGREAGIEGLTPHDLRHTYATRLREDGLDPAQIQKLMGHSSVQTTARYFRASDDEVAAAVEKTFG